jgi:hypothetical protein
VVYRLPARLVFTQADTGQILQDLATCGDADDLFLDSRRRRIYVSCGGGQVDVFQHGAQGYQPLDRIPSRAGARTSLFDPQTDRLYVAARADGEKPAAILVFRPRD